MTAKWKPAKALRNEAYLAWVRSQPSVESGNRPCVSHHVIGNGRLSSLRTSDYFAIPLTDAEHKRLHDEGWNAWEARCCSQLDHSLTLVRRAIRQGVLAWKADANLAHWTETLDEYERAIREGELVFCKRAALMAA